MAKDRTAGSGRPTLKGLLPFLSLNPDNEVGGDMEVRSAPTSSCLSVASVGCFVQRYDIIESSVEAKRAPAELSAGARRRCRL